MATNLALQLQVIEPDTDLNSIMIGNSNYNDDVWDLRPFITAKSTKESQKYIRFEYIADVDMKETVKQYAYYKLGKMKPQTVRDYINAKLPMFIEYCSLNGIHSFADGFLLGSRMLCVARTFLFRLTASAADRPAAFKSTKIVILG